MEIITLGLTPSVQTLHTSGFGFNNNIFETNIINLAVVVGIVYSFVKDNLSIILNDRKKTILSNLEEASHRAIEAQEKLSNAKIQLDLANKKVNDINQEGLLRVTNEVNIVISQHENRLLKLDEYKNESLQFYQQKAFKEAYLYIVSCIMAHVNTRFNNGLNPTNHTAINNFYISRFIEYNSK